MAISDRRFAEERCERHICCDGCGSWRSGTSSNWWRMRPPTSPQSRLEVEAGSCYKSVEDVCAQCVLEQLPNRGEPRRIPNGSEVYIPNLVWGCGYVSLCRCRRRGGAKEGLFRVNMNSSWRCRSSAKPRKRKRTEASNVTCSKGPNATRRNHK